MHKLTILFGALLILLGVGCFVATGSSAPTALIPASFGLILAVCGILANTEDPKRRMLWMHIAVTVGLLGFLATIPAIFQTIRLSRGAAYARPIAIEEKAAMSLLCLLFVSFCVRSFLQARRARLA